MAALDQLNALLPRGIAWTRRPGSVLQTLLGGLAEELDRVQARVQDALLEALPSSSTEMLEDLVRLAGLTGLGTLDPDGPAGPLEVARRALHVHWTTGPLTVARFKELCSIFASPSAPLEFVSREHTDVDEATITYADATNAELEAAANREKHATGTLVFDVVEFEVEEDGFTLVLEEEGADHVVEEA
ncbi:MAG: DUF2313 domain-containing protein [Deltaproteobacteria bacterium]|nr:DUF2313 domain-containing protein [Deltaproteobacteria bacterium]